VTVHPSHPRTHARTPTEDERAQRWANAPLAELIDHVLGVYHRAHAEALPRVRALAKAAVDEATEEARPALLEVEKLLQGLADELAEHMHKEETVLFPWIRSGRGRTAGAPMRIMCADHQRSTETLITLRRLAGAFDPSGPASPSRLALCVELERLERDVDEHIHLENDILFPRALAG